MSNNRNNGPELDYYELRRRHEQYKSRSRAPMADQQADSVRAEAVQPELEENFVQDEPVQKKPRFAFKPKAKPAPRMEEDFEEQAEPAFDEGFDDVIDEAGEEDDFEENGEELYENPNPFSSFINFFNGVKGNISAKRESRQAEDEDMPEAAPAKRRAARKADLADAEFDDLAEEAGADVEEEQYVSRRARKAARPVSEDEDMDGFDEENFDDEDDYADEDRPQRKGSGFKRFMSLFVTRVDEDGNDIEYDYDDFDEEDFEDDFEEDFEEEENDVVEYAAPAAPMRRPAPRSVDGGQKMSEEKQTVSVSEMAGAMESSGMSRRERRELAMRLAAEEAARKAAEEAAAAEAAAKEEAAREEAAPIQEEPAAETVVETVTMETAVFKPVKASETIVEEKELVEEPTREFKPVKAAEPFSFEDEDEDEEEEEEPKPRMGIFARRRARKEEVIEDDEDDYDDDFEDDDYDDEDDDYDDFDDEDEEEEEERPAKRRGLFGRRKKKVVDDDDDDEYDDEEDDDFDDEYDEYDDDDEDDFDDEYDDYDDEDEDEDDDIDEFDDEDDGRRSFGHHLLGVLRFIGGVAALLALAILVLNILYAAGHGGFVNSLQDKFGETTAFQFMFPCCRVVESIPAEVEPEATAMPVVTAQPTAIPAVEEAAPVIPNLDSDVVAPTAEPVEENVIEAAPVVEQAPVQNVGGTVG